LKAELLVFTLIKGEKIVIYVHYIKYKPSLWGLFNITVKCYFEERLGIVFS